jgi:O-antigen/teichoic acid export membrane protein
MSVLKNYSYNLIYQITLIVIPIITIPYVSRILGSSGLGIFAYTGSIVQYFLIFANLGLSIYASREIAYVKHDNFKRSKLFTELIIIQFSITFIVLIAFFLYLFEFDKTYFNLYLIQSISIVSIAFDISWFYIGIEDFKKNVIRNLIVKLLAFTLLFIIIKKQDDLWKYILLTVGSIFLGQLYMWFGIGKYIMKIQLKQLYFFHHINKAKFFFLIMAIGIIGMNLNKTLIGLYVNPSELGKYDMSLKLIMMSLIIITSLGSVMTPRIAAIYIQGDLKKIKEYLKMSFQFTLFFSFLIVPLLIGISNNFVHWFLGSHFNGASVYMMMLSPMIIINSLSNLLATQYMIPSGNEKKYFYSLIFGCTIGILSSLVLVKNFSVFGACISIIIGESSILFAHIYQIRGQSVFVGILKYGWHFIVACIPIVFVSFFLEKAINIPILLTFVQIIISVILYLIILFFLKNEFLYYAFNKIKSLLKFNY